ncbi:hypothetical protein THRCLA_23048 [Thraustotheca clavata]|uniref:Uncharacterized protein n=1 Tax=Thraustotheca clavata TaxID=74557 RepID=A0A1V9YHS8_9STRA|nr:hypothetical protein THRCLA_23048 [Thraustotheca clavata]
MGEDYEKARILQYFIDFTNVMESNGLISMLGGTDRDCQKKRCKLLIENLQPEVLKVEITRIVILEHREAKADDVRLYNLILQYSYGSAISSLGNVDEAYQAAIIAEVTCMQEENEVLSMLENVALDDEEDNIIHGITAQVALI